MLETERLRLRHLTEADAPLLYDLDADPHVMRYLTGGKPTPYEVISDDVLPGLLREYQQFPLLGRWVAHRKLLGRWVAHRKEDGQFVGWFALRMPQSGDGTRVELGYRLLRQMWGQGFATEGARALVLHAFTIAGGERVYAETMAVNTGSRRVLEKAGLSFLRSFHVDWDDPIEGAELGEVEYAVTREDWSRSQGRRRE